MPERVTVIGGGHGLAAVVGALRDEPCDLTVVVTVADDGGSSGELRRRHGGPAVGDLRRALIALAGEEAPLARALARPITVDGAGRHPLGNLLIRDLANAVGDLTQASEWLGSQLGIHARVLPATAEPLNRRENCAISLWRRHGALMRLPRRVAGASALVVCTPIPAH